MVLARRQVQDVILDAYNPAIPPVVLPAEISYLRIIVDAGQEVAVVWQSSGKGRLI